MARKQNECNNKTSKVKDMTHGFAAFMFVTDVNYYYYYVIVYVTVIIVIFSSYPLFLMFLLLFLSFFIVCLK